MALGHLSCFFFFVGEGADFADLATGRVQGADIVAFTKFSDVLGVCSTG